MKTFGLTRPLLRWPSVLPVGWASYLRNPDPTHEQQCARLMEASHEKADRSRCCWMSGSHGLRKEALQRFSIQPRIEGRPSTAGRHSYPGLADPPRSQINAGGHAFASLSVDVSSPTVPTTSRPPKWIKPAAHAPGGRGARGLGNQASPFVRAAALKRAQRTSQSVVPDRLREARNS